MAKNPNRRKRPSAAAVARHLAEVEARPSGREMPAALTAVIDTYRPSPALPEATMEKIRPFLHAAISASGLTGAESVRKHCNHLTRLGCYALKRGVPLEVDKVLTTAFIDDYVRVEMAEETGHLRAERRCRLLALAATANPGPDVPAKLTPVVHSPIKACYSPAELAVIMRVCRVQPTKARQRDLSIVVALSGGAGLDSVDMRSLLTDHIEDLGAEGILVHVQGPRPRTVVVRAGFEQLLREAIADMPKGVLLLGRKQDRRNTAARATERAALHNVPHIEPARLRATWLADLMTDSIPLAVILKAAGLKSARTLSELQPHLGPWLEHKGLGDPTGSILRGEGQ